MPNTKPYNKEEVMKEFEKKTYDSYQGWTIKDLEEVSTALDHARQAGEERVREKAVAIIKKNHEEECYPGECSCYLTLEALK